MSEEASMPEGAAHQPLVSVIIPARNAARTLAETLLSICAQSLAELEVIVVDDGSTDATADIVRCHAKDDPRIRLLQQRAIGVCAAKNTGARAARGEYLTFLDSDDLWDRSKLERQVDAISGRPRTAVITGLRRFADGPRGREWLSENRLDDFAARAGNPTEYIRRLLFASDREMVTFTTCMLHRTDFFDVGGWRDDVSTAMDWELWLRSARVLRFMHLTEPLQFYRKDPASKTRSHDPDWVLHHQLRILSFQPQLGGVHRRDLLLARSWRRLEFAQLSRAAGRRRRSAALLIASLRTPRMLWTPEWLVETLRLTFGLR
jgi:glycosyltransferase involved in cell wall biosynthesis